MKIHTPIGFLWLDADESGLTAVSFQPISESKSANQQILTRTQEQFEEYFTGKRKEFEIPLSIKRGTPFQQNVWKALSTIPYGEIRTYKEVPLLSLVRKLCERLDRQIEPIHYQSLFLVIE